MHLINDNIEKIYALCRKYGVKTLSVFGSILTPRFNEDSDVDFAATFYPEENPAVAGKKRLQFYIELEDLIGRRIDLVSEEYIKNPFFRAELEETKQLIYEQEIQKYLCDINECIIEIEEFVQIKGRLFETFLSDTMFLRAIERNISIIGEAMTKILQIDSNIDISEAKNIKRCRNYVVHAYDSLDSSIIWGVVINDLPKLKEEVKSLLKR